MTANYEIRRAAIVANVRLWEVAELYGCVDSTFSRKLRRELPPAEKARVLSIIAELAARREREESVS